MYLGAEHLYTLSKLPTASFRAPCIGSGLPSCVYVPMLDVHAWLRRKSYETEAVGRAGPSIHHTGRVGNELKDPAACRNDT